MKTTLIYISIGAIVLSGGLFLMYKAIERYVTYSMEPVVESYSKKVRESMKPIDQTIATDISVSSEWQIISPESAMKATKQIQTVYLSIYGYKRDANNPKKEIKLADGTVIRPELEIVDEHGKTYALSYGQPSNPFGFTLDWEKNRKEPFPRDRSYPELRIRSDKPFRCTKIVWSNQDVK